MITARIWHIALAAFAVLTASVPLTNAVAKSAPVSGSPRQTTDLSTGWRFQYGDAPEAVTAAGFDDSGWEQVSVPHTWNRIGEYSLTRSSATDNRQGIGYYRLTYAAPTSAKGRRQYLDFAAVAIIADVWVNGVHVGQHKGAFSRFRFDVTSQWKPGAVNLIVVKADNSKPAIGSTTQDVIPLAGDFFIHGGMYRGVSLIEANDVGIDLLDFGGPGVYVRTGEVGLNVCADCKSKMPGTWSSSVDAKIKLHNRSTKAASLSVALTILDPAGRQMAAGKSKKIVLAPNAMNTLAMKPLAFGNVEPWGGDGKAVLYAAKVSVYDGTKLIDSVTQPFGIRDFKFDPNTGFTLNGTPLKLHGVSRHQDRLGKGYALSRADHAEDMAIMKEMGVNAVRMAHYQHDDAWADEADKAGMVVWAEVPYVTTPSLAGGEGSSEVFANAEQQTRELIRQNYNHPSIMMWSVGNEVDASALFGLGGGKTKPRKLLDHIAKIAREEDPSRPTIFADCCEDVRQVAPGVTNAQGEALAGATDLIGYNRYYGWYYPEPLKAAEQLATQMDKFHVKHPTLPISISEYGAGGAISQHSDNVTAGFVNATGRPQPEEYESWVHEQSWPVIRDRQYIWGSYVWNMFDFASDLRNEGDSVDINTKGLVTFGHKVKKDAFYYYQAQWAANGPMIHLTGKRYVDRAYSVMDVKAYTNQPKAFLSVNGEHGPTIPADCPGGICIWNDVKLQPGPNKFMAAVGFFTGGMPIQLEDYATFNGPDPAKDGIRIDVGDIAGRELDRHCGERSDAAIQRPAPNSLDCRASLAMTGKDARRFGSDNFVTGGTPAVLNQGGFGGRGAPKRTVAAPDIALYDYWREGEAFSYAIPVPDGQWTVTIYTFEPRATGSPMMSVWANGKVTLPAFNVAQAAGGSLKGLTKSFPVTVKGGILKLDFSAIGGKAVVAAIEVTR